MGTKAFLFGSRIATLQRSSQRSGDGDISAIHRDSCNLRMDAIADLMKFWQILSVKNNVLMQRCFLMRAAKNIGSEQQLSC